MAQFLESEKRKQEEFKAISGSFNDEARADGIYKGHAYRFCLPRMNAEQNLFPEIRESMLSYFSGKGILWHDGQDGKPSNHLCSSQVCCANFLFPLADKPLALAALLHPIYPNLVEMLPIEDHRYVAFEWIGEIDYLGELKTGRVNRTRGANCTSADAAVKFRRDDGQIQMVLIEWKYTESYSSTSLKIAPSGTDRTRIYQCLYNSADCILNRELIPSFGSLFSEPFYQLMRQQFLAQAMEKAQEEGANWVSVLHISPSHNDDFKKVTSADLNRLGNSPTQVWQKLVKKQDRFSSIHTEDLFGKFNTDQFPELRDWWNYISHRYHWVVE